MIQTNVASLSAYCLLCYSVQNQAFYRTGIFGNFFLGGKNFAFSKREFPVALVKEASQDFCLDR